MTASVHQTHRLPCWLSGTDSTQCRRHKLDLWAGRSPGEGSGAPLQYSCLGNPMNKGDWCATAHGITKESDTSEQLSLKYKDQIKVFILVITLKFKMSFVLSGFI